MPSQLDRRATDLRDLVMDIVRQFQQVNSATVNGPHVELSMQELRVVEFLGDRGPRIMREVAEFLPLAVNSVTTLIDNLEKKRLVRRQRSEEDRRVVHVGLTESGKAAYNAAIEEKKRLLRSMLNALTEDEQEIFMVLFRKIARAGQNRVRQIASTLPSGAK
jgi:MarR family 2-MHQ and catechol resistance regulon transcriptional repressor